MGAFADQIGKAFLIAAQRAGETERPHVDGERPLEVGDIKLAELIGAATISAPVIRDEQGLA